MVETRELSDGEKEVKTYCVGSRGIMSSIDGILRGKIEIVTGDTYTPRQVQRAIATGEITHYSALETKALE